MCVKLIEVVIVCLYCIGYSVIIVLIVVIEVGVSCGVMMY